MDSRDVKSVVIVGAGTMGHSIAQVFAQAGIDVGLVDINKGALERALRLIKSNLKTLADFGRISSVEIPKILERIHPSTDLAVAAQETDFALEAVVEVPDVKREVFRQLDELCSKDTILASNTSTLDVFSIADIRQPSRLVVSHWFAPPYIIPLVEVVPGPKTSSEVITFTANLMERLGKRPVIMKRFVPSFIVNRIQQAIIITVMEMLENGWATPEDIDLAVKTSLGVRLPIVGAVQTLDFTGLDLIYDIQNSVGMAVGLIKERVEQGHLGVKTSKGIYDYGGRSEEEILQKRDELYLKMLNYLEDINAFDPV
ncbi:MAG: 3-hydroxyacyl-CoA dehydrogenase family protein [Deltaproteobacteria bacterium]|nr:3-hydroxyacyl-CoA dehydrogenase family protein [Deltaproteobacteria bacterium]